MKRHIQTVVSSAPSKATASLEHDASELILNGMVTLNSKLIPVEDEDLVDRVVDVWMFFWDEVLPYVEGVSALKLMYAALTNPQKRPCYRCKQTHCSLLCTVSRRHTSQRRLLRRTALAQGPLPSNLKALTSALLLYACSATKSYTPLSRSCTTGSIP